MKLTKTGYTVLIILAILIIYWYLNYFWKSVEKFTEKPRDIIPKIIYMCCKDKNDIPEKVTKNWKQLNPDYQIKLYDDDECYNYLVDKYGQDYGDFYNEIPFGPIKADLWRLCILYKTGGVYSDIDIKPYVPINDIINEDDISFCSCLSTFKNNIFQAFIYTTKENPILKTCIDHMFSKRKLIQNTTYVGTPRGAFYWKISGTHDMYKTLKDMLNIDQVYANQIYYIDNQKIKILEEYTPTTHNNNTRECKVRYNSIDLLKSRYSDYKMYEHTF
jgi:hypothetical protein